MPLEPINGITAPSNSQIKAIETAADKNNNTLLDLFIKNLSPDGKGTKCSIGAKEKVNLTRATLGDYRIDLQKYNNDGTANFAIQTNGQNSKTVAVLFMPPDTTFTGDAVAAGFTASLTSRGKDAYRLP